MKNLICKRHPTSAGVRIPDDEDGKIFYMKSTDPEPVKIREVWFNGKMYYRFEGGYDIPDNPVGGYRRWVGSTPMLEAVAGKPSEFRFRSRNHLTGAYTYASGSIEYIEDKGFVGTIDVDHEGIKFTMKGSGNTLVFTSKAPSTRLFNGTQIGVYKPPSKHSDGALEDSYVTLDGSEDTVMLIYNAKANRFENNVFIGQVGGSVFGVLMGRNMMTGALNALDVRITSGFNNKIYGLTVPPNYPYSGIYLLEPNTSWFWTGNVTSTGGVKFDSAKGVFKLINEKGVSSTLLDKVDNEFIGTLTYPVGVYEGAEVIIKDEPNAGHSKNSLKFYGKTYSEDDEEHEDDIVVFRGTGYSVSSTDRRLGYIDFNETHGFRFIPSNLGTDYGDGDGNQIGCVVQMYKEIDYNLTDGRYFIGFMVSGGGLRFIADKVTDPMLPKHGEMNQDLLSKATEVVYLRKLVNPPLDTDRS